jgi:hypothetical protein
VKRIALLVMLALATVLVVAPSAPGDAPGREKVDLNPADQAAARAAMLRLADLGPGAWTGGMTKPDLSPGPVCVNYHPKQSDLVLTGVAESNFQGTFGAFSQARVLRTAQMVQRDWQRSITPGFVACYRRFLQHDGKMLSLTKIPFPRIAEHTVALRGVAQVTDQGTTQTFTSEFVRIAQGRTEIMLTTLTPGSPDKTEPDLAKAEGEGAAPPGRTTDPGTQLEELPGEAKGALAHREAASRGNLHSLRSR